VIVSSLDLLIPFQNGCPGERPGRRRPGYGAPAGSTTVPSEEPFSFNLSGRTGEAGLLVVELATLIGEALEQSFLPQIRPPLFSTPAYLLALDKPVFAPLAVFDGREEDGGGILRACSPPIPGPPWPM
jgi:hypothetical protein